MNFFKRNWHKSLVLSYFFIVPVFRVYADAETCDPGAGIICNPIPKITSIGGLVDTLLTGVIRVGIPIVALAIIYCGFLFVAARGNTEKLTKAKDALLYTLIGAVILLGSWAIAQLISDTVLAL